MSFLRYDGAWIVDHSKERRWIVNTIILLLFIQSVCNVQEIKSLIFYHTSSLQKATHALQSPTFTLFLLLRYTLALPANAVRHPMMHSSPGNAQIYAAHVGNRSELLWLNLGFETSVTFDEVSTHTVYLG